MVATEGGPGIDGCLVNMAADNVIRRLNTSTILSFHMISLLISYKTYKTRSKPGKGNVNIDGFESFTRKVENRAIEKLWGIKILECNQ